MSKWQPIETAPKDGTRFLVYWLGRVDIARWNIEYKDWQMSPNEDFLFGDDKITHWIPLPEPPQETE